MTQERTPESVPRSDGMPMLGLGTWQNEDPAECARSVETALEMGYRHVDTAQIYQNEAAVGEGLAAADVDREEIFLATKVWTNNLSYDDVLDSTEESLDKLGTDYVDLLYVHWPANDYAPEDTLPAFEKLQEDGRIGNIGVSNFEPHHVDRARDELGEFPFANQVELHPFLKQEELRDYAADTDLDLVAYSPLARAEVFGHEVLADIAESHGVSEAQVSLAWVREKGVTAIPKATSEAHIRDNWESPTLDLTEAEIERIDAIEKTDRRVNPNFGPDAWE
jgi:2,5-diketo-D-gluconate reductase B